MMLASSVSELIGDTPLVRLKRFGGGNRADIYAKLESLNPGGSVKDRVAKAMIQNAEEKGLLKPGGTIIEPTSGNTGIGLAMLGASKGYKVILVMPETMSIERRRAMEYYGARIFLTDGSLGMAGAVEKAMSLVAEHENCFMPMQFENPINPTIHEKTTAPEILSVMGKKIDTFVAGVGTGGTITGVGRVLKREIPKIKVIAVEPKESAVLSGAKAGSHLIQGIGAGFIPKVLDTALLDEIIQVRSDDAIKAMQQIATLEGISVGISSGAVAVASLFLARRLGPGHTVVTLFPDGGERYLSVKGLF
jgi:cysteine synthase A